MKFVIGLLIATAITGGCARQNYATDEVTVQTDAGTVTCQLYTRGTVLWDESTSRPVTMSPDDADDICRRAGVELMNEIY